MLPYLLFFVKLTLEVGIRRIIPGTPVLLLLFFFVDDKIIIVAAGRARFPFPVAATSGLNRPRGGTSAQHFRAASALHSRAASAQHSRAASAQHSRAASAQHSRAPSAQHFRAASAQQSRAASVLHSRGACAQRHQWSVVLLSTFIKFSMRIAINTLPGTVCSRGEETTIKIWHSISRNFKHCRTGPPGYTFWLNWFLGIDTWAPYNFKNLGSVLSP